MYGYQARASQLPEGLPDFVAVPAVTLVMLSMKFEADDPLASSPATCQLCDTEDSNNTLLVPVVL